ncbi:uncharacterized protein BDR25DRAFT_109212 [Lindgomyces ingoldianus]|uniref:Uncharacterized protein n=1 Tax=Lindgomyces ingoldianus TaxID=673940 RepID=A0ACB6R5E3_9PLEO|nr:uncharacterized protein BDR25DRAFT_109212 [Lindgomyces ingoldianus]KAF2474493.1 hypothetical protein BDR25DRAFT_109212 [Lindgomyces ingoldianus]
MELWGFGMAWHGILPLRYGMVSVCFSVFMEEDAFASASGFRARLHAYMAFSRQGRRFLPAPVRIPFVLSISFVFCCVLYAAHALMSGFLCFSRYRYRHLKAWVYGN